MDRSSAAQDLDWGRAAARVLDYRGDTPTTCPVCDAVVSVHPEEQHGTVYIDGERFETIWHTYACENGHEGPVMLG